jgi:hypothetical protein
MRFNLRPGFLLLALPAALFTGGCGLKVFDSPPPEKPIAITGVPTGCLSGIPAKIDGYLRGTRAAADVQALGDCLDQALLTFEAKTRGAKPGQYSSEELRTFLNRFFAGDAPLPEGLFAELMKVKQAVLGGEASLFTQAELAKTRDVLKTLTGAVIQLAPVGPDTVRPFTQTLANILEDSRQAYDISDAEALLRELEPWVASPDPDAASARAVKAARADLPWARAAYVLLFPSVPEGGGQTIQARDWRGVLETAADAYDVFFQANRAWAAPSWRRGSGRVAWLETARRSRHFFGQLVSRSQGRVLTWATLNRALETVYPERLVLFGKTVSVSNVEGVLPTVVGKAFGPGRGQAEPGINAAFLDRALEVVENFYETQAFLEEKFAGHGRGTVSALELLGATHPELASVAATLPGSLDPRGTGDLVLPGSWNQVPFGMGQLEIEDLLWREELARTLIHGYAGGGGDARAMVPMSLKENELVQFYMDARPLGVELKYFDPVDPRAPTKRFRDASLFLFPSNGDERLDLAETTELIRYLLSGKRSGDAAHAAIARNCQTGPLDPYGFVTIEPACFQREYYGRLSTHWASLPGLRRYYSSLSRENQAEFARHLEYLSRKKTDPRAWFDSDDSESMATFVQYIESFFTRFDRDGDGQIGGAELDSVYSVVDGPLKRFSCVSNPSVRRAVFNYLIRYGQAPDRTLTGTARFLGLWGSEIFQYFKADRLQLLRIFSELSKAQSSGESCQGS